MRKSCEKEAVNVYCLRNNAYNGSNFARFILLSYSQKRKLATRFIR